MCLRTEFLFRTLEGSEHEVCLLGGLGQLLEGNLLGIGALAEVVQSTCKVYHRVTLSRTINLTKKKNVCKKIKENI